MHPRYPPSCSNISNSFSRSGFQLALPPAAHGAGRARAAGGRLPHVGTLHDTGCLSAHCLIRSAAGQVGGRGSCCFERIPEAATPCKACSRSQLCLLAAADRRERSSGFGLLQALTGTPSWAFWASTLAWDLLQYTLPCVGIVLLMSRQPQYSPGPRLGAAAALLAGLGAAGLPATYLLQMLFQDEMAALMRLNTLYFMVGYLGFLTTVRPGPWVHLGVDAGRCAAPRHCLTSLMLCMDGL